MELTERQNQLFEFVKQHHGDQKRKYTFAPYWTHLLSVAETVSTYPTIIMGVEIALCHDLLEDTKCTPNDLEEYLQTNGYEKLNERMVILRDVSHLTDEYTSEAYPALNREKRKTLEAKRLIEITPNAQSVKYADIIDNTSSIVQHDPGFARVYLKEIGKKIYGMDKGEATLYRKCLAVYAYACSILGVNKQAS